MRLIDAEPIIKNLSAMKTQLGYDAIDIDGMIKALREAEEVTASPLPNDPLTLEELREMDGEPVWVDGALYHMDPSCGGLWGIVTLINDGIVFGDMDLMPLKDIVGFAYRCKPEEGPT